MEGKKEGSRLVKRKWMGWGSAGGVNNKIKQRKRDEAIYQNRQMPCHFIFST